MNFIHHRTIENLRLTTKTIAPRKLSNIDGSNNATAWVTQEFQGELTIGAHKSMEKFAVANIGEYDLVIGHHFLRQHKPTVKWNEDKPDRLIFASERCSRHCLPFPADVYRVESSSHNAEIHYLNQLPETLLSQVCAMRIESHLHIDASESHSATIAGKHQKPERPLTDLIP